MSKFIGYLLINNSLDRKPTSLIWLFVSYPNQWECCRPQEGRGFQLARKNSDIRKQFLITEPCGG